MATETAAIRSKTRRVKEHILNRYLSYAERVEEKGMGDLSEDEVNKYWELTMKFAPNCVPRMQEITGEDGEAIKLVFDPVFNALTPKTERDNSESSPVQDSPSGA